MDTQYIKNILEYAIALTSEFVTFAIGSVAERLHVSFAEVYRWFKSASIIDNYLVLAYDVLHTFCREHLTDDLIDPLNKKGVKVC